MSKLFLEIVPRTEVKFSEEIHSVSHLLNRITGVNIPYTHSCQLNTISAIDTIQMITNPGLIIPHIRARDFVKVEGKNVVTNTDSTFRFIEELIKRGITEILIIQGDPHEGEGDNPNISPEFIEYIKNTTQLRVYGAIDQYREKKKESERIKKKIGAGTDGFFTQPFFSTPDIEIAMNNWHRIEVLYGFAPVTTDKSKSYWESTNNVIFPSDFSIDPEENIKFARDNVELLHNSNQGAYLMPIRFDAGRYLNGILK